MPLSGVMWRNIRPRHCLIPYEFFGMHMSKWMSVDFDRQLFCYWTDFFQTFRDFFHPIKSEDIKFSVEGAPFGEFNGKLKILLQISHPLIIWGGTAAKV